MATHSPIESVHALDVQALLAPEITFWTAWQDSDLLGCAALKELVADPPDHRIWQQRFKALES